MLRVTFLAFLFAASLAAPVAGAADLCNGLVQDKLPHPMTPLAKPGFRQSVVDPQFGTTIRRITAANESTGGNAVIIPMYSTMQAWNADETYMILYDRTTGEGRHNLYDGKSYQFLQTLPIRATDLEQVLWDPNDPDLLYYPSNYNAVPNLMSYRVSTGEVSVVRNFQSAPTNCPAGNWGILLSLGSDPQYMSFGPAKVLGLQCGNTKFTYSISANVILGVVNISSPNAPGVTPSGGLAFLGDSIYDYTLKFLYKVPLLEPYSHSNLGRSASGHDTLNEVSFDDPPNEVGSLVTVDLWTGQKKVIVGPATGYPYPPSTTHISSSSKSAPGWAAVSIVGDPAGQGLLDEELLLANTDTSQVCRIGHHRSYAGVVPESKWGYWSEPHNVISPSGTRVLFGSDWGNGNSVDSYVVELPGYVSNRSPPKVTGFFLIDKNTGQQLREIKDGDTVNVALYAGHTLDIQSQVTPNLVTMMYYYVNGQSYSLDWGRPYTTDGAGNYAYPNRLPFVLGTNTLAAVALDDLAHVDGDYLLVTFTLAYQP
jgi:hypothetical protein